MGTIYENELDKSIEEHKWKIKILKSYDKDIMLELHLLILILIHQAIILVDGISIAIIQLYIQGHLINIQAKIQI